MFKRLYQFLKVDIWRVQREDISPIRYLLYEIIKKVMLAVEYFTAKRMMDSAAALTYSTLLAIVPIMAVVFAIARGFGYNKYIESWFRETLSSQPQAAEVIIGFVNSYLVHTKSGIFLGIGLLFMLWTVIMLISNIEKAFNGDVPPGTNHHRCHLGNLDHDGNVCQRDWGVYVHWSYLALCPPTAALCHHVGCVPRPICLYAEHESQNQECHHSGNSGWCGYAGITTGVYTFTDLGDRIQCHLRILRRLTLVYVVGTDLLDHLSVRCRAILYEPEPGGVCLPCQDRGSQSSLPSVTQRLSHDTDLSC